MHVESMDLLSTCSKFKPLKSSFHHHFYYRCHPNYLILSFIILSYLVLPHIQYNILIYAKLNLVLC